MRLGKVNGAIGEIGMSDSIRQRMRRVDAASLVPSCCDCALKSPKFVTPPRSVFHNLTNIRQVRDFLQASTTSNALSFAMEVVATSLPRYLRHRPRCSID